MKTYLDFFKALFSTLEQIIKIAPVELFVALGLFFLVAFFLLGGKIKRIPAIFFAILFSLMFVQLPGFIYQYRQSFAGALTGIELSIEELNDQQLEEEINNTRQVERLVKLHNKISKDVRRFQEANAITISPVFLTHIRERVYKRTMENYVPVIVLNLAGFIAMAWGALFGFLVWALIKTIVLTIFPKKKNKKLKSSQLQRK